MTDDKRPDNQAEVDVQHSPLTRWSARKTQARRPAAPPATTAEPAPSASASQPDAEPLAELTDADMPPLDSIDEHSDVSGFFSPKVSAELRRQALRKLFQLPVYNIRDGLNDYDDDFTNFAKLGDVITSDMRHLQELKAQRQAQADADQSEHLRPAEPATDEPLVEPDQDGRVASADGDGDGDADGPPPLADSGAPEPSRD